MALKERMGQGWIHCTMILEVLGRPKEYVDEVIKSVAESIGKTPDVEIINKKFHEPTETHNLFSTFTELELAVKDLNVLAEIVFGYMPSNIEILAPAELKVKVNDMNHLMNLLAAKLHAYDAIAKRMKMENMVLKNKLVELGALPKEVEEAEKIVKEQNEQKFGKTKEDKKQDKKEDKK